MKTPRTDSMEPYNAPYNEDPLVHVPKTFARQLERELQEAQQKILLWKACAEDLVDQFGLGTPAKNCSCHISPPCSDCTEHTGQREALETLRKLSE